MSVTGTGVHAHRRAGNQLDSTDVFYKHLQLNEIVVTGLAGDSKMKEMPAPVSVIKGKTRLSLYIIGSNLTNQVFSPHLSRLKYIGIANMGRNVTFKLVVPFQIL